MLRFGPEAGPVAVLALPLFEEANRTRAFGVGILRALAARGIGGVLPELPGQGESERPTDEATLAGWRAAFAAAAGTGFPIAIRSGALLVGAARRGAWLLAPQTAPELLRELSRVKGGAMTGERMEVAGNVLGRALLDEMGADVAPADAGGRVVRLASDPQPADRKIDGSPLWRRAEPDNDSALAQLLAADISDWIRACAS